MGAGCLARKCQKEAGFLVRIWYSGSRLFGKKRAEGDRSGSWVFGNVRIEGTGSLVMIWQRGSRIFGKYRAEGEKDLFARIGLRGSKIFTKDWVEREQAVWQRKDRVEQNLLQGQRGKQDLWQG